MFGKRLSFLRKKNNLTQQDLAKLLNISPSTVGMYEQGRRDPDTGTINFLSSYFDVTSDYLLGRTDKPKSIEDNKLDEEYILQAATLGDALIRLAELTFEIDMDDETFANLVIKAKNKYGLPGGAGGVAAHGPSYPGSGALEHLIPDEDRSYKKRKERARKKNYNKPHGDDNN